MGEEESGLRLAFIKKKFSAHGGAEQYLQTLMGEVKKAGHEIHVLANEWAESAGITFHRVPVLALGSFLSTDSFNRNVRRVRDEVSPDCTISFERTTCQDIYRAGDGCHAEWLRLRARVEPPWKRLTFRLNPLHRILLSLERKIFCDTPLVITNSNMVKGQIEDIYKRPGKSMLTIYNGVDLAKYDPERVKEFRQAVRKDLAISGRTKVLLFVGSGFERKGLAPLLHALPLLTSAGVGGDFLLLVAGRGNEGRFGKIAAALGVRDKVRFLGPQRNVERLYGAADVFVLPTLYDPFSNATLEAMASGLPVVTTSGNGAAEIITEGTEGFVVGDPLDHRSLAEKIGYACEGGSAMGEKARQKAEEYPIEKAAEEFLQVLTSLRSRFYVKLS